MRVLKTYKGHTSFHGHEVRASVNQLVEVCGEPRWTGSVNDKVQYEWLMQTEDSTPFTIYDYKEYRYYSNDELIDWHIGGISRLDTLKGSDELYSSLNTIGANLVGN